MVVDQVGGVEGFGLGRGGRRGGRGGWSRDLKRGGVGIVHGTHGWEG